MTLEQIWKKHGVGTVFFETSWPNFTYIITGRWKYGILFKTQNYTPIRRIAFNDTYDYYSVKSVRPQKHR